MEQLVSFPDHKEDWLYAEKFVNQNIKYFFNETMKELKELQNK